MLMGVVIKVMNLMSMSAAETMFTNLQKECAVVEIGGKEIPLVVVPIHIVAPLIIAVEVHLTLTMMDTHAVAAHNVPQLTYPKDVVLAIQLGRLAVAAHLLMIQAQELVALVLGQKALLDVVTTSL